MFNRDGYAATSQAGIAAAVGIAPGNLTYHFPAKLDLVLALREEAQASVANRDRLGIPGDVCADYVRHVLFSMTLVWRYRFLLRDRSQFLGGEVPSGPSSEMLDDMARFEGLILRFRDDGLMRQGLDIDLVVLTRSLWVVSRYWLDHLDEFEQVTEVDWSHVARGLEHHRVVLEPCLTAEGRRRLDAAFSGAAAQVEVA